MRLYCDSANVEKHLRIEYDLPLSQRGASGAYIDKGAAAGFGQLLENAAAPHAVRKIVSTGKRAAAET